VYFDHVPCLQILYNYTQDVQDFGRNLYVRIYVCEQTPYRVTDANYGNEAKMEFRKKCRYILYT